MTIPLTHQDQQHRSQALRPDQSFIVQAPAGSGKTELLIQRFLTLLSIVKFPEEILAITFTKKAANEMRTRIINALHFARDQEEPTQPHEKLTWQLANKVLQRDLELQWQLFHNPNRLRIQTIDALCANLTRQLPLLSHFGAQPDIADDPVELYRHAAEAIITYLDEDNEWSIAIERLLMHLDNDLNKLNQLLIHLLAKRDQWLPYIYLNTTDLVIRKNLEKNISAIVNEHYLKLETLFPNDLLKEIMDILQFTTHQLGSAFPLHIQEKWECIAKLLLTQSYSYRKRLDKGMGFPALASIKNKEEKQQHQFYREKFKTIIDHLDSNEDIRAHLEEVFFLPESHYTDAQWDMLHHLFQVLKITAAQLQLTFQHQGKIDFIENAQAALLALGDEDHPTDLTLALDYKIQHLLIDEFQDTSYSQYQLLEKLTAGWQPDDGRTLFIVGDPMQSIYRFREAEVSLFIRLSENGLKTLPLTPLTLSLNFRSSHEIVTWNNFHFSAIFPKANNSSRGAITFTESVTLKDNQNNPQVNLQGFLTDKPEAQANIVVKLIQEALEENNHQNIAILVRSRAHLKRIIPALKTANIAYNAIHIDSLSERQAVQDALSLTCALLNLGDRIAWLSILRAPWAGLSLNDLHCIANSNPHALIIDELHRTEILNKLSDDGRSRVNKLLTIIDTAFQQRDRACLRTWIESTWLALGGAATLKNNNDIEDIKTYFDLLTQLSHSTIYINVDILKKHVEKLYASTQNSHASVHIMTIHSAKGLEFDTVILPHLESKMPSDETALLEWIDQPLSNHHSALLLAPIHATGNSKEKLYHYIHRLKKVKSNHEQDRLFYVATTRAKKNLHLLFNIQKNNDDEYKVQAGCFLENLWPLIKHQADEIITKIETESTQPESTLSKQKSISRLVLTWENPYRTPSSPAVILHKKQAGFLLSDNTSRVIGTATHFIFEQISKKTISWWSNLDNHIQSQYIARQLLQHAIQPQLLDTALLTVKKALSNALQDPKGQWILSTHREAESELALTVHLENKFENVIIDRTFVDENNIRWIIDYKTGDGLDKMMEYKNQLIKYKQIMQKQDEREIKLGLYFPSVPRWEEVEV